MELSIGKWGNSAALRLPSHIMNEVNLHINQKVDVSVENGILVLKPIQEHDLDSLLSGITEENKHSEFSFGGPVGNEAW
jgi:antitoxin MazE